MTGWQDHCERWRNGCGNDLCSRARHVVLARGTLPCDVLLIGEGPGDSENVVGRPFVGPAGAAFQRYVLDRGVPRGVTYALANLLGCMPTDEAGHKAEFPDDPAVVLRCGRRLAELAALAAPRLIVCVGSKASQFVGRRSVGMKHRVPLPGLDDVPRVDLIHPAAVIRKSVAQQGMDWQTCEVVLRNAVEDHVLYKEAGGASH